ncbi:hypothetical protein RJ640_001996 [Escallonia rubra]|uniref:Uncharacterized protein n=1 Tax=Escallonia rubra TaxID=112253 RepID=A0AA88RS66_9ASTE|nr:hypothetical protein RJ640_001996 [Escallonia rubra]
MGKTQEEDWRRKDTLELLSQVDAMADIDDQSAFKNRSFESLGEFPPVPSINHNRINRKIPLKPEKNRRGKTYAEMMKPKREFTQENSLNFVVPQEIDGHKGVEFTTEDVADELTTWQFAIIAYIWEHDFRFKNAIGLQATQRSIAVFASNTNPPNGNSLEEKSDGFRTGDGSTAPGPPFLTILAGFLVLLLVVWIFGSIVMWLISLIVNVPPSK